jgi:ECF sigma factor
MRAVTHLLEAVDRGDQQAAADLLPLVYTELRRLAAARTTNNEPAELTLMHGKWTSRFLGIR